MTPLRPHPGLLFGLSDTFRLAAVLCCLFFRIALALAFLEALLLCFLRLAPFARLSVEATFFGLLGLTLLLLRFLTAKALCLLVLETFALGRSLFFLLSPL